VAGAGPVGLTLVMDLT
jgi:2-polyprenyl-6-methoxyphenol hydroxylase-like FAD-dependent oxidoreductase